ncbi:MAG: DEAD/DEAH box helicase [Candidatus Thermoplasmatota archaeon]|nr:DEAD/DEAH box helicase [Candidatus Thermoplasmatota archaeon]
MDERQIRSSYPDYEGQIEFSTEISKKKADHEDSEELHPELKEHLNRNDISLYSHQAEAVDSFIDGNDVCITTGTASGKTLAYALSIANVLRESEGSTVLLIFPTKALTRDQKEELEDIFELLNMDIQLGLYDGDVSPEKKREVREKADLILTNFTGLNLYLNSHEKWVSFFENVKAVVIDEAHHYKGLLGMHVAWIIRRLRRICRYYSEEPRFILASATLGNPDQHSKNLVGRSFDIIVEDGSESGKRTLMFWNPGEFHEEISQRKSTHRESSELLAYLVDRGYQTLMFASSRKMTELDALWAEDILEEEHDNRRAVIEPYNAGHSKKERRRTEKGLREGEIDGVVSTTALELGINIGGIDSTLLSGYPGSRISFWQQIGRAGRGEEEVLSVLIPFNSALDQYIVDNPDYLLGESIEDAVIDLSNNHVYSKHLLSAAEELPLTEKDKDLFTERLERAAEMWKQEGSLGGDMRTGYRYLRNDFPQQNIDLYSVGDETFEVQIKKDSSVETMLDIEKNRAYRDYHMGAIYLHQGEYYEVTEFEEGARPKVVLEPVDTDYYTVTLRDTSISDIEVEEEKELGDFKLCKGTGKVRIHYFAYKKKRLTDDEVLGTESTGLEPITLQTQTTWIEIPDQIKKDLNDKASEKIAAGEWLEGPEYHYQGAIHAAEHSLIHMLPLLMLIDEKDVGGISTARQDELNRGAIFIYDGVEGGVGFSHDAYEKYSDLIEKAVSSMKGCSCGKVKGCPACTFSADCGNDNDPLNRVLAIDLLSRVETSDGDDHS